MRILNTKSSQALILQTLIDLGIPYDVESDLAIDLSTHYLPKEDTEDKIKIKYVSEPL